MNSISDKKEIEKELYSIAELKPYKSYKVEFRKEPIKPDGIYFQYNYGCTLYSLINIGWINEDDIPSSMKFYKNHAYSQDEKSHKGFLIRILSLLDLAQLWINLGGKSPYKEKETKKEIKIEKLKEEIYGLLRNYILKKEKTIEDVMIAYNIVKKQERFVDIIGNIKIKPMLLSQCEFGNNLQKLNLKNGIDNGYIKENEVVCCLNHYIVYYGIKEENSKKYYIFSDSFPIYYIKIEKEGSKGCIIDQYKGIIKADENSSLLNIEESPEKRIGILKLYF